MAHNLTFRQDGSVEYAYAGEKPWHGLGTAVDGAMTAEEAIRKANLGWTVSKRQMMTLDGVDCPEFFAIVRDDNNLPLGQVGSKFVPTQINQAFAFCDAVVGEAKAKYVSVGSIGGGKRIFIVAQLPGIIRVKGDDITERYLTFAHGHDGTMGHRLYLPSIRVVCQNTLEASLRSAAAKEGFFSKHVGDLQYRVDEAADILGFANRQFEVFEKQANALADVVLNVQQVESFIRKVFEVDKPEDVSPQKQATINTVLANFESRDTNTMAAIRGTAWALLCATTEYVDHQAPAVTTEDTERRFRSIMFNGGAELKGVALKAALDFVK